MENPLVEYMDIRNWGRNRDKTYPVAVEGSNFVLASLPWYINKTTVPIMPALASP